MEQLRTHELCPLSVFDIGHEPSPLPETGKPDEPKRNSGRDGVGRKQSKTILSVHGVQIELYKLSGLQDQIQLPRQTIL